MAFEDDFEDDIFGSDVDDEDTDGVFGGFDDEGEIDYDDDYVSFDDLEDEEDEDFYEMDDE